MALALAHVQYHLQSVLNMCPLQSRQESERINKTLSTLYLRYATVETTTRYTENKVL